MKKEKYYKDGTYIMFNYDLYAKIKENKPREYDISYFSHKIYKPLREIYFKSPWHKIKSFVYNNKVCIVQHLSIIWDSGFVIKLTYQYEHNSQLKQSYRYIHNVNSNKYLRLLKLSQISKITYN